MTTRAWLAVLGVGLFILSTGCAVRPAPPSQHPICLEVLNAVPGDGEAQAYQAHFRASAHPYFKIAPPYSDFSVAELDAQAFRYWRAAVVSASWEELALHQLRTLGQTMASSRECLVARAFELTQSDWDAINREVAQRDLYHDWRRWVGLYPLSAAMVQWRIRAAQRDWRAEYGGPFPEPATLYQPNRAPELDPKILATWMADSYQSNPLQLPQLPRSQLSRLMQAHAPDFEVLQASSADRIGTVINHAGAPQLDLSQATVYVSSGYAQVNQTYLLQLQYTLWLPERPKAHALDLYGGHWNGLTWRVTLDTHGQPLWHDSIHNCGCYHQIWKPNDWVAHAEIGPEQPLFLEQSWTGRPRITLLPNTHYVRWVDDADRPSENNIQHQQRYRLTDYTQLMVLPGEQTPVSLFAPSGLITGSERLERYLLWPFGVKSPGTMRRQGHHAIAFVGKRNFDDPRLWSTLLTPKRQP
jgi:hypothetical protein